MKILVKYCFILVINTNSLISVYSQEHVFQFEGNYQGENIYIQNPLSDSVGKYCTKHILINEIRIESGVDVSAYEIRLDTLKLKIGDPVKVTIFRYSDCTPKIISKIVNPKPTFEIRKIAIDSLRVLKWTTEKETGKLMYTIQQFVWNKWISIGEMGGKGNASLNEYEFTVHFHSGKNKFRVLQKDGNGKNYLSKEVEIDSKIKVPKLKSYYFSKNIDFTLETRYEIYDSQGNVIKKGFAQIVETTDLLKGQYYVNFDNQQVEMIKR